MNEFPILLLTGYLGAGKTTVLNHLIRLPELQDKRIALLINEFGDISIDGALVEEGSHAKFELNKGSLFCVCVKTDFIKVLGEIADEIKPDLVIIEATGIAETRDIEAFAAERHVTGQFRIQSNLCVIDALNFTKVAPMLKAVRRQVQWADGVIINKKDLVGAGCVRTLHEVVCSLNPRAAITGVTNGTVSWQWIENLEHTVRDGQLLEEPPDPIFSSSFQTEKPVNRERFLAAINTLGKHILRLKGHVNFEDGPVFIEKVGEEVTERELHESMPKNTAFVVVAWEVRQEELENEFKHAWPQD